MHRPISAAIALWASATLACPATAMDKAQLVDLILSQVPGITEPQARGALDSMVETTTTSLKKGDRVALAGFGTFGIVRASVLPPGAGTTGIGKPLKVAYRGGNKNAGTLRRGPNGTWDLVLGLPAIEFLDDPLEAVVKLPKPFDPPVLEIDIGLPSTAPGSPFRAMLDTLGTDKLVLDMSFGDTAFDDFVYDESDPGPDYLAAFFPSFHPEVASDDCAESLLSERIGFAGVQLCDAPGGCPLSPLDRDALVATIATAAGIDPPMASSVLDVLLAFPPPAPPPVVTWIEGLGSFTAVERAPRTGRHPLTEKTIKSPGKKVIKFKAGIEIAGWTW